MMCGPDCGSGVKNGKGRADIVEFSNQFKVASPIEKVWDVLTDVERIAPCMPGARLQEVEGDEFRGLVKVKVGPISAEYQGNATFLERDAEEYRAVLKADGREVRGQGKASATITAALSPDGSGTAVTVTTELTITGKVAQFGRGVLADVSGKLLGEFVQSLESTVLAANGSVRASDEHPGTEATAPTTDGDVVSPRTPSGAQGASDDDAAAIDLFQVAGPAVLKRLLPAFAGILVLWMLMRRVRRGGDPARGTVAGGVD